MDGFGGDDSERGGEGKGSEDEGGYEGYGALPQPAVALLVHHILLHHLDLCLINHHYAQGQ